MNSPPDRRFELRSPANERGLVLAPGFETPCVLVDQSAQGGRIRLDRNLVLPKAVVLIDIDQGIAIEAQVAWQKGVEAGLKRLGQASLRGLVPSRLSDARAAWLRAGGR
jgi:hypothetical protein